jgi:4-hydroxy-2-oxoheptanedioate aldolase
VRENQVKKKMREGKVVVGVGMSLGSVRSVEAFAATEPDYLMVDLQHGHFDKDSATNALRSIAFTPAVPFARVASNDPAQINDALDAGALGVVVPMVNTRADAEAAVRAAYYHPAGERSRGSLACVPYGDEYPRAANDAISLVVMIETPEGVGNAREILSVAGIHCALIGPSDLSLAMGCSTRSVPFQEAVSTVVAAARANGVAVGIAASTAVEAAEWQGKGVRFFLATHDTALLRGLARQFVASFDAMRKG